MEGCDSPEIQQMDMEQCRSLETATILETELRMSIHKAFHGTQLAGLELLGMCQELRTWTLQLHLIPKKSWLNACESKSLWKCTIF